MVKLSQQVAGRKPSRTQVVVARRQQEIQAQQRQKIARENDPEYQRQLEEARIDKKIAEYEKLIEIARERRNQTNDSDKMNDLDDDIDRHRQKISALREAKQKGASYQSAQRYATAKGSAIGREQDYYKEVRDKQEQEGVVREATLTRNYYAPTRQDTVVESVISVESINDQKSGSTFKSLFQTQEQAPSTDVKFNQLFKPSGEPQPKTTTVKELVVEREQPKQETVTAKDLVTPTGTPEQTLPKEVLTAVIPLSVIKPVETYEFQNDFFSKEGQKERLTNVYKYAGEGFLPDFIYNPERDESVPITKNDNKLVEFVATKPYQSALILGTAGRVGASATPLLTLGQIAKGTAITTAIGVGAFTGTSYALQQVVPEERKKYLTPEYHSDYAQAIEVAKKTANEEGGFLGNLKLAGADLIGVQTLTQFGGSSQEAFNKEAYRLGRERGLKGKELTNYVNALRDRGFTQSGGQVVALASISISSEVLGGKYVRRAVQGQVVAPESAFKVSSTPIASAGFGEGFATSVVADLGSSKVPDLTQALSYGSAGFLTAGVIGGKIVEKSVQGNVKGSEQLLKTAYVIDPYEAEGDILAELGYRALGKESGVYIPTRVITPTVTPSLTPTITPSVTPVVSQTPSVTPTVTTTPSPTTTTTLISDTTLVPEPSVSDVVPDPVPDVVTDPTPTPTPSPTPTTTSTATATATATATTIPTPTTTTTTVPTPTATPQPRLPLFPFNLSGFGIGGKFRKPRASIYGKAYLPSFSARALGLKPLKVTRSQAKKLASQTYTGLEVRRALQIVDKNITPVRRTKRKKTKVRKTTAPTLPRIPKAPKIKLPNIKNILGLPKPKKKKKKKRKKK